MQTERKTKFICVFPKCSLSSRLFYRFKDSEKFRLSEEYTNKFVYLSVRNLSKLSEKQKKHVNIFSNALF